MDLQKLSSKFITDICEKNYSNAYSNLEVLVAEKIKSKIKKIKNKLDKKESNDKCDCGCDSCKNKN